MKMNSEESLNERFREAGSKYGYDSVTAKFEEFQDIKVRWQRSYRWAEFKVTDYIRDAPDRIFEDLAKSIFAKINGVDCGYPDSMKEWLLRPQFVAEKRPVYLQRYAFKTHTEGTHKDLGASMKRLADAGLVPQDLDAVVLWTEDRYFDKLATSSVLMRTVFVSETADSPEVPDNVLDYAIYSELCRMMVDFDPTKQNQDGMDALKNAFEGRDTVEKWILGFLDRPEETDADDRIIWSDPPETEGYARKRTVPRTLTNLFTVAPVTAISGH